MKNLILIIAFILTTTFSFSQNKGVTITVTVDNVPNNNGKVSFALHTAETFMKGGGIMNTDATIKDSKVVISFNDIEPGEYAILVLHDANENGRMDYRENGMPIEAYGASNNVMAYGPPQYEDSKFKVEHQDLQLNIRL
jgi:uncharacterized protein (DUF2141 family)